MGGVLEVDCDSEIQDISIEQNGTLIVHSGANINDVINTGGSVIVAEDATVNNFIQNNYSHEIVVMSGAEINDMLVAELGSAIISGDGIINNAIVERGCSITMSGGTLDGFKNDGVIDLSGSAVAKDGTVTDYIEISSGAQVSNIDVKSGGIVYVSSGGMLNQSFINGSATVWGGMAEQLVIGSGGDVDISGNSIVEQVVVNSAGKLSCLRSGYISDLTIKAGGQALLASGDGILVEYGGELYLSGTPEGINDITLAGGRLNIYSDPSSLPIYVKSITFALSGEMPNAMINADISKVTCSQYYLSVAEGNSTQEYILCNNSNGFSQSITVVNSAGGELGKLAVGESLSSDYGEYSLKEENGQLLLDYTAFVAVNENISGLTATLKSAEELAAGESVTLTSVNYTVSDSQIDVFAGTNGVLDGGAANVTGNVAVTVTSTSGDGIGALYGGGLGLNQNIGGDVLLTLESGTYGYIYTGGYSAVTGNVKTVIGDVTVNNNIYGGTAYTNPDSARNNVGGSTTVEISSGVILNQVYAGNYVNCDNSGGEVKSTVSGGSYLNISGGTFTGPVVMAGGVGVATGSGSSYVISEVNGGTHVNVTGGEIAYLYGGGRGGASTVNADYGASVVNDGSHITISGGDIKVVYGGGYCDAGYSYVNGGASITLNAGTIGTVFGGGSGTGGAARNSIVDNVNITVDATGDLSIADIYGGGNGRAQISGDVTITLHGSNGHNLSINGLISGGGRNGVSGIGGDRTLQFEDYQGSLDATIVNFNTIRVNEYTEVALSKVQDFSTVDTFIFDAPMQTYDATAGMLLSGDTVWGGSKLLKLNVDSGVYDAEIVLLSNLGNDISSFADASYEFNVLGTLEDGYSSGVLSGIDLESGLGTAWYNEIDEAYYRLEIGEFDTLAGLDLRLKVIDAYSDEGLQLKAQLA